jgi:uncharacterized protein
MLIELYGANFGCFRDEFRLSMLATDIDPGSDRGLLDVRVEGDDEPLRLLRAVAIYGPNGSGKSTIIRAATALRYLIGRTRTLRSDSILGPYEPFALTDQEPVRLGIKAVIDGNLYDYEVRFKRTSFVLERLLLLNVKEPIELFHRDGQQVRGEWTKDERFALLCEDFRMNALLLSLADRLAPALAKNIAVGIRRLLTGLNAAVPGWSFDASAATAKRAREDAAFSGWLLSHLKAADVGVIDMRTEEVRFSVQVDPGDAQGHSMADGEEETPTSYRLSLLHRGTGRPFSIPYHRESQGTQRLVQLAPLLYDLAHDDPGRAAFVDEIDESLHPLLLQGIIRHLNCEIPLEKARGQLIFVTHETALLDAEAKDAVLRRDQVYLTEKDSSGAARLYSIAEFRERNNLNLRRRYLQGRYGALPSVGVFAE